MCHVLALLWLADFRGRNSKRPPPEMIRQILYQYNVESNDIHFFLNLHIQVDMDGDQQQGGAGVVAGPFCGEWFFSTDCNSNLLFVQTRRCGNVECIEGMKKS